ncbi:hypothetical protein [Candidatus Binatus sp.]|uniref:hypothetical protein n=1 Tax=Candidatus Binatus sp. TaxID=2811406 RepID=UPI003CC5C9A0
MKVVFKVERKSRGSKFYMVNKYLRDESGHDIFAETVSTPLSYTVASAFRRDCEQREGAEIT